MFWREVRQAKRKSHRGAASAIENRVGDQYSTAMQQTQTDSPAEQHHGGYRPTGRARAHFACFLKTKTAKWETTEGEGEKGGEREASEGRYE